MAKFGAGDPRCIVSDRPDGRNVNEWHWLVTPNIILNDHGFIYFYFTRDYHQ